ncbi:MAG: substrate-binding domain-containing protein [Ignavibacteria bacterium]|nr:Phosphate-binding protein PstS [Ignavibacteria bacterium]MCC6885080.1 substrate-binding domain-containing protein [Ignavibacteriales bacterium]
MQVKYWFILLIVPLALSSCQDYREIKPLSTSGSAYIAVDENFKPAMEQLINEFIRLNPNAKLDVNYVPSRNAVAELVNNQTKLIVITRPFNREESDIIKQNNIQIDSHKVAVDAVAFIVNPYNPILRVTSNDLMNIFTGEYKNWTDIVAQDKDQNSEVAKTMTGNLNKIKTFIQRRNSATYDYVKENVLKGAEFYDKSTVCSTSAQMLQEIRENENAIGISNLAWLGIGKQDALDTTVKALRISIVNDAGAQRDYVQLHQGLVFNGEYPYDRVVYIYTTFKGIGLESGFISFMLQTPGQQVLLDHGVVPATQPVRTIQLN